MRQSKTDLFGAFHLLIDAAGSCPISSAAFNVAQASSLIAPTGWKPVLHLKCGACVKACPSEAAGDILNEKILKADCFSCGRCLSKCPVDAIKYGVKTKHGAPSGPPYGAS